MSLVFLLPARGISRLFSIQGRKTITSHHADHQIDRKERNQPYTKVLGLEK